MLRSAVQAMEESLEQVRTTLATLGKPDPSSPDVKASDEFLDPVFRAFYHRLGLLNLMQKTDDHDLARFLPREQIDPEVGEKLDALLAVAGKAKPAEEVDS